MIFKTDNQISTGTDSPFVGYSLMTQGSGYPGGSVVMPPYGYNTAGNVDRYPFALNSEGGTYAGKQGLLAGIMRAALGRSIKKQCLRSMRQTAQQLQPK